MLTPIYRLGTTEGDIDWQLIPYIEIKPYVSHMLKRTLPGYL